LITDPCSFGQQEYFYDLKVHENRLQLQGVFLGTPFSELTAFYIDP